MGRIGTVLLITMALLPAATAGTDKNVKHEAETTPAILPAQRPIAYASVTAEGPFTQQQSPYTLTDGPVRVRAGQAEFEGEGGRTIARMSTAFLQIDAAPLFLEARGIESVAVASCAANEASSSVRVLLVNGASYAGGPSQANQRIALPGLYTLILNEQIGVRTAAYAEQVTNAARILDAQGRTVALLGHAQARTNDCVTITEGVCDGFAPLAIAAARAGDRAAGPGAPEILVGDQSAQHAWLNGVWTHVLLAHDEDADTLQLALRGTNSATASVPSRGVDAVVVTLLADGGTVSVDDLRVTGLAVPSIIHATDEAVTFTLRSVAFEDGFRLEASTKLSWPAATPPGPNDLALVLTPGRCG